MQRITASISFFFILALGLVVCTKSVRAQEMPQILYVLVSDSPYPRWVAADAAFDANGEVVTELCDPGSCIFLDDIATSPPDPIKGCILREEGCDLYWDPPDRSTLTKSVRNSQLVFLGEVVGAAFGFRGGTPGQLLRVVPVRDFKGVRVLDEYFFFFPVGAFMARQYKICKIERSYPTPPVVGDEVLLMVPRPEDPNEPLLDIWRAEGVVVIHKSPDDESEGDAEIHFPRAFQNLVEVIRGREELIEVVGSALEEQ